MTKPKRVQDTHISRQDLRSLHDAMVRIAVVMNRPQNDEAMVRAAGITLDRALFPLLVGIERKGPIGVGELADGVGRDYSTVSRQVSKLESLGLTQSEPSPTDRRVRQMTVTAQGKAMTTAIDAARERIGRAIFEEWEEADVRLLVKLMGRFSEGLENATRASV
ncbi:MULTISPECIES: MarR family winged helix-turn-helix transcriptional regulator [unclassified Achromobacter]|uniref:MarR family winged helix-turn-helix transcriptional regulator n=1 Tax=unclassified Achromobacter TaxID=2626865 RepID=UPI000B51D4CD|nr:MULTISPECIES: MarR family winged helix-turn-helix transcriptional regulator [unclassified Achromobacter]OWT72883.1 MarR family transcriptional regulator [Achromobacter sp. HZ34]OWT74101.1 MarR family transcriptional regulator [Achromobacter sp. HZ28]